MMVEIKMRCNSWYGNELITISLPSYWQIKKFTINSYSPLTDEKIKNAIFNPLGTKRLSHQVKGKKSVCIAVDDLTKPTETFRIAPYLIDEITKGGVKKEDIFFIISTGTHRAYPLQDLKKKLGEKIVSSFRIYNHNPYQNNEYIGKTKRDTPLYINKFFLEADYKIGIGMLMPHNLAGFSGGGKIVLPGLASIETIERNHRATLYGLQGGIGTIVGNQVREDIEEAAEKAGLDFIINSIHDADGKTIKLFCGKAKLTYKVAVKEAQKVYACSPSYDNDIGIFNAFPRDNFFLLSLGSLNVWSSRNKNREIVKKDGTIVIINYCSEGAGEHGLMTKGMKHYVMRDEHGTFKDILKNRDIIFLSPNLHRGIIKDYYKKEVDICHKWNEILYLLKKKHKRAAKVALFPCGPLMMDKAVLR